MYAKHRIHERNLQANTAITEHLTSGKLNAVTLSKLAERARKISERSKIGPMFIEVDESIREYSYSDN